VASDVLTEVRRLLTLLPGYSLRVTGHSLGAALAHLTGMNLIKAGYNVQMINFGQPRLGDDTYAAFANKNFSN
jgi:putative lipase involved disintegration of autophagic bodies